MEQQKLLTSIAVRHKLLWQVEMAGREGWQHSAWYLERVVTDCYTPLSELQWWLEFDARV